MKRIILLVENSIIVIAGSCNNQSSVNNKSKEMKHEKIKDMKIDSMNMDTI